MTCHKIHIGKTGYIDKDGKLRVRRVPRDASEKQRWKGSKKVRVGKSQGAQ